MRKLLLALALMLPGLALAREADLASAIAADDAAALQNALAKGADANARLEYSETRWPAR